MTGYFKFLFIALAVAGAVLIARPKAFSDGNDPGSGRIRIQVRETGEVTGPKILIKDVALITAPAFIKEAIGNIEIGASPKPDKIEAVERQKIEYRISRQSFLPENISLSCPPQVYVKRQSQRVSKEQVTAIVRHYLENRFQGQPYQIVRLDIKGMEPYPRGKIQLLPDRENILRGKGRLYCHLDVIVDKKKVDRLNISGEVAVFQQAFFASKHLLRNTPVRLEDFYQKKVNIYNMSRDAVKDPKNIPGKVLVSDIRKGQYLTRTDIAEPPLVKKGEIIQLVARNKGLVITTSGISKEDGVENQLIRVENLYSGKLVRAVVTDKSRGEVVY